MSRSVHIPGDADWAYRTGGEGRVPLKLGGYSSVPDEQFVVVGKDGRGRVSSSSGAIWTGPVAWIPWVFECLRSRGRVTVTVDLPCGTCWARHCGAAVASGAVVPVGASVVVMERRNEGVVVVQYRAAPWGLHEVIAVDSVDYNSWLNLLEDR